MALKQDTTKRRFYGIVFLQRILFVLLSWQRGSKCYATKTNSIVDSLDWKDLSPDEIYNRVVPKVKPGSIVLFHNAAKNTPAALPRIIEALQGEGYNIVPISQLIMRDNFTVNPDGMQVPAASQAPVATPATTPAATAQPSIPGGPGRPTA